MLPLNVHNCLIDPLRRLSKNTFRSLKNPYIEKKTLVFRKELDETSFILNKLSKEIIGKEIAFLRTDMPEKPFLIKILPKGFSDEDHSF